jgi:hypothetical protein
VVRGAELAEGLTAEQLSRATGLSVEDIRMLGRMPYELLRPHATSGRYRLSQVSWARKLAEMHDQRRLTWLEIRAWAEIAQNRGRPGGREREAKESAEADED